MAQDEIKKAGSILGDIMPEGHVSDADEVTGEESGMPDDESIQSMDGGSQQGRSRHSGSREVTTGPIGGTGTEVGGTRNYRQGTGATGGDIGNRPE
jgi:hypothetical protein